jgi:microcystin-dependent protein
MGSFFVGQILLVAFPFAPTGWALCNGQTLLITEYTSLFALIGTFYGGDGKKTFNLPNLQSRVPIHQGTGEGLFTYTLGEAGGADGVTLVTANLPAHTHPVNCNNAAGGSKDPTNGVWAQVNNGSATPAISEAYAATSNAQMAPSAIGTTGENIPFSIIQPFLCMNYIIALTGTFPSRS